MIPADFTPLLTELSDFSRNKIRVNTLANDGAKPYDVTIIPLPETKLALSTFSLGGTVTTSTTAGGGSFAVVSSIESLVDQIYVEFGGISIMPSMTYYNQIWQILSDLRGTWNKKGLRKILALQKVEGGEPTANQTAVPFQLSSFLGFLNDIKVLPLDYLPPCKIYIKWASPAVLTCGATTVAATYELKRLYATVDVLGLSPSYDEQLRVHLKDKQTLSYPFTNFSTIPCGSSYLTQTSRWSTSANAVEKVYGTFLSTAYNTANAPMNDKNYASPYFTRGSPNLATSLTSRFTINGSPLPTIPMDETRGEILLQTMQTLCEDHDYTTSQHPGLTSSALWAQNFWVHALNLTYDDADSPHRVAGVSGLGNQLLGTFETVSTNQTDLVLPLIFLQHKSVLEVSDGRNIRYIH